MRLKLLLTNMILKTEIAALLPSLPPAEVQRRKNSTIPDGQLEVASVLVDSSMQATKLTNLTSAVVLYFSSINPAYLNDFWTEAEQKAWLGGLLLLHRRAKFKSGGAYLKDLIEKMKEFIVEGAGVNVLPEAFRRGEMEVELAAMEEQLETLRVAVEQNTFEDLYDRGKEAKAMYKSQAAAWEAMTAISLAGASGAGMTSALAATGTLIGGGALGLAGGSMAMGPVGMALAPILGGVAINNAVLPDDDAGHAGKMATGMVAVAAPVGVYAAVVSGGTSAAAMSSTLAGFGGGTIAAGGGGMAAGVTAIASTAAISVVAAGLGVYAAYKIADHLYIDDEERERFECDCTWTSSWVCPSNERAASVENLAENDGSLCYNYCCEKVEAMMHAAKDIIQERDDRADKVDIAMKLLAEVAARKDTAAIVPAAAVIGLGLAFGAIWLVKRPASTLTPASLV